jgi:site-specific recombinase XerD
LQTWSDDGIVVVRHYSARTEDAYVFWVRKFILFHNKKHPAQMREPEITLYVSWLATERRLAASTQNQALSALLFLYRHVLGIALESLPNVPRAVTPM